MCQSMSSTMAVCSGPLGKRRQHHLPRTRFIDATCRYIPQALELNTTDSSKAFHVPNTYITLLWILHKDSPIEYKVLCNMISDAIIEVTNVIKRFGDNVLPDDRDPYVDSKYAGKAPKGCYISIQSPRDGPAYGRKLTWGNVKDALSGLAEVMIKHGRPYKMSFEVRHDAIGLIGRGCVTPGEPSSQWPGIEVGLDDQS